MRSAALIPAALFVALAFPGAEGQSTPTSVSGGISVSATILAPPLTAVGSKPLQFGTILPGTPLVSIGPDAAAAGQFRFTGIRNRASATISFTLPTKLLNAAGDSIMLNFNGDFAALCEAPASPAGCDAGSSYQFNPVTENPLVDTPNAVRRQIKRPRYLHPEMILFLGGEALPRSTGQSAGSYTGTVAITVVVN